MAKLSPIEQAKLQKIMADPVLWARAFLRINNPKTKKLEPWSARDYQEEMLRDNGTRVVYRLGRRCVPGWVRIMNTDTGEYKTVDEWRKMDGITVAALNQDNKVVSRDKAVFIPSGQQEVFHVKLKSGKEFDATGNHPFLTADRSWVELAALGVGDSIATPSHMSFFGKDMMNIEEIKFLAYMIGDGNCTKKTLRFSQNDNVQLQEMREVVRHFGCELIKYESNKEPDYHIVKIEHKNNRAYPNLAKEFLIRHGVFGHNADTKSVPNSIMRLNKEQVALFLNRLWSTDGWASSCMSNNRWSIEIGYCSNSKRLIEDIAHLLLRFGINCYIRKKCKAYMLSIRKKHDILTFAENIGIFGKETALQAVVEIASQYSDIDDYMPICVNDIIKETAEKRGIKKNTLVKTWGDPVDERLRFNQKQQRCRIKAMAEHLELTNLFSLANGDIVWDEIVSIESIGIHETYSLVVPEHNTFIFNDVISHNCGKTESMVVGGLHKASTNKNFRILYVTPYETQVNLIFMRIREIIADSPLLKAQITKMKNSPYTVEFSNGSVIMGFTTGASSGSGAASVRGQKADWIYMDEIDYMGELDYSTVAAIAGERVEIGITASSTPTGKRGTFYRMCMDESFGYHEHYHPSMHNPNWCQEMEDQFRAELTEIQYEHEILAEFGTEEAGVFDKDKLDAAMKREYYLYNELTPTEQRRLEESGRHPERLIYDESNPAPYNPFRCMGVDYDKFQAGSSLLILDFDMKTRCFKVMKRIEVPRGEYTLDNAVNWVIKLNKIYNPAWIFCDRGFGDYQLERLHIYGDEHPETNLRNKVVGYQFKESLEIMDPITKEMHKEPLKQFMVSQLSLNIERDRLILSPFDETLHKQLIDYEVDHISANGMPVYTSKNEHFVDALGLAHLAFVLKFPDITAAIKTVQFSTEIKQLHGDAITRRENAVLRDISNPINPWKKRPAPTQIGKGPGERPGDYQQWVKVPMGSSSRKSGSNNFWGKRSGGFSGRSMW